MQARPERLVPPLVLLAREVGEVEERSGVGRWLKRHPQVRVGIALALGLWPSASGEPWSREALEKWATSVVAVDELHELDEQYAAHDTPEAYPKAQADFDARVAPGNPLAAARAQLREALAKFEELPLIIPETALRPRASHRAPLPERSVTAVNAHGLMIDAAHAHEYLTEKGDKVIFGGDEEARAEKAAEWVTKDHTAVVYYEGTRKNYFGSTTRHLFKVSWFAGSGEVARTPFSEPGPAFAVNAPRITSDLEDPGLQGARLPAEDDLATLVE